MNNTNGTAPATIDDQAARLAAAKTESASCLRSVIQTCRMLQSELRDLTEAEQARRAAGGGIQSNYPHALAQAVDGALRAWARTPEGAAALNLPPPLTYREQVIANARQDLKGAEELLQHFKDLKPTEHTAEARRLNIENAAQNVIRLRRRLVEMEGGTAGDKFKAWLRGFAAEVKKALQEPVVITRDPGKTMQLMREMEESEARRADPLGSLIAEELAK